MSQDPSANKSNWVDVVETTLELTLFNSRWLLAPLYVGLIIGLLLLLMRFVMELIHIIPMSVHGNLTQLVLGLLEMIDMVLFGNLILIVLLSGYSNFVSRLNAAEESEDRPDWLDHIDFGALKLKVVGSIVAISAIELLGTFVEIEKISKENLAWKIGLHMVFVLSGLLFAITELIQKKAELVEASMSHPKPPHHG
ncbi:MAG: TIGR00645 family protein [Magnetococcales bacterium]|nr:TIGR00645 family protein [Magnetococcales bacterium]